MTSLPPLLVHASLNDLKHHDDDTIDVEFVLSPLRQPGKPSDLLVYGLVRSDFWSNARVEDYYCCRLSCPQEDIDLLVLAVFEALAPSLREFGTDFASCDHLDFRDFLSEHLPPDVASRIDAALCERLPQPPQAGNTIEFHIGR